MEKPVYLPIPSLAQCPENQTWHLAIDEDETDPDLGPNPEAGPALTHFIAGSCVVGVKVQRLDLKPEQNWNVGQ